MGIETDLRQVVPAESRSNAISKLRKGSYPLLIGGLLCFFVLGSGIIALPRILSQPGKNWTISVSKPNELGDTIGGIAGPAVGMLGVLLTFLAFWAQIRANNEQRTQFQVSLDQQKVALEQQTDQFTKTLEQQREINDEQVKQAKSALLFQNHHAEAESDIAAEQLGISIKQYKEAIKAYSIQDKYTQKQQFESRFYALLTIHRENARSVTIPNTELRAAKAFPLIMEGLKGIYTLLHKEFIVFGNFQVEKYTTFDCFQLAYHIFFFGLGTSSENYWKDLLTKRQLLMYERLHQAKAPNGRLVLHEDEAIQALTNVPSKGHSESLSHYIRHLYQMVRFIDSQPEEVLSDNEKYEYVTTIRAQLSTGEQLFLYYNSLSILGFPWRGITERNSTDYFTKYCMVKSLPLPLADFYKKPLEDNVLPEYNSARKAMFEWTEIKNRMNAEQTD